MQEFVALRKKILENYFSSLNSEQKSAVFTVKGPLLILAGAGSGKTTVLISRIVNMIKFGDAYNSPKAQIMISQQDIELLREFAENGDSISDEKKEYVYSMLCENPIKPWNILAITFTNKAANELKERLEKSLGECANDINASTFHSACVRILRRDIEKIGYQKNFTIYDTDDSKRVVKDCLNALNLDEKRFPVKSMLSEISRSKDRLITPMEYLNEVNGDFYKQGVAKVYLMYQERLKSANAVDFDDIIMLTVRLLKENKETLEYYRNRFRYIMVDEYQDTNMAQYELISLLAGEHKNLCVVGDDDQSIYRFRGATIENILNFEDQFENTKVIRLEQNYRSTQNILDAANEIIKNNRARKGKNLWTDKGNGEKIYQYRCEDERSEADYVTEKVLDRVAGGGLYSDCAVLYRTNSQSNNFERSLVKSGVPYRIIGGHRFYERMEVKDIISYLCVINNKNDELRLERIINQPKRAIGDASVKKAKEISRALGQTLFETICRADEYTDLRRSAAPMCAFGKMMKSLSDECDNTADLGQFVSKVITTSGYDSYLKSLGDEGLARIDNIQELVNTMTRFSEENPESTLSDYLEEVALLSDIDNYDSESDSVVLMTVHSAKGLEFKEVFLVGMEEGLFPSLMSIESSSEIEEERRLAYVGVTRAKEKLHITSCAYRMMYGRSQRNRISRFVNEIPDNLKDIKDTSISQSSFNSFFDDFSEKSYDTGFSLGYSKKKNEPMFTTSSVVSSKPKATSTLDYKVGDTVSHRVFGEGMVVSMTPMANDTLVEVSFDRVGTKKIMANFAKLIKK